MDSSCLECVLWGLFLSIRDFLHLVGLGLVELHKLGQVKLGFLHDLDLFDEDILERENLGALFSDSFANLVTDELLEELLKS
jgi:hypothetical protein